MTEDVLLKLIQQKQEKAAELLSSNLKDQPSLQLELESLSNTLADRLTRAFTLKSQLEKRGTPVDPSSILSVLRRPTTIEEHAELMRRTLLEETEDASLPLLREKALSIIREDLTQKQADSKGELNLPIHEIYKMKPGDKIDGQERLVVTLLAADAAKAIAQWTAKNLTYVSDPPGDYIQPPLQTLEIVQGGDCDDLALLTCSLWRSIGFETFLAYLEDHVIPGVKLRYPEESGNTYIVRDLDVPFDPTSKIPFGETAQLDKELRTQLGVGLKQARIFYVDS